MTSNNSKTLDHSNKPVGSTSTDAHWDALPKITPSSVSDSDCNKRWHTLRVLRQWPARNYNEPNQGLVAAAYGKAVHETLNQLYRTRSGGCLDFTHIKAMVRSSVYNARYPANIDRESAQERVLETVLFYASEDKPAEIGMTIALEKKVEFPFAYKGIPRYMVSATLDRVFTDPDLTGTAIVVDVKTTRQKIDLREAFIQLWCLRQAYPPPRYTNYELRYDWIDLDGRTITRDTITSADVSGQHPLLRDALISILDGDIEPRPSNLCCWCPLRSSCVEHEVFSNDTDNIFDAIE